MIKPPLLIISALAPWPTTSGGATRVSQTLKYLSKKYEIHLITFVESTQKLDELKSHLARYCRTSVVLPKQSKKSLSLFFTQGIPYWFSEWYHPELAFIIHQLIQKYQIRLVQIETSQLLYLVKTLPKSITTLCTAYDVQVISFWRRLTETKNLMKRLSKVLFLLQVYWYEAQFLSSLDLLSVVSEVDKTWFKKLYGYSNAVVVPNGYVPIKFVPKQASRSLKIGFIGSPAHSPNREAIRYLIQEILPILTTKISPIELVLAGETNTPTTINLPYKNVTIRQLGFVENLSQFYQAIDILVAPLFSGSGTRIKILESVAYQTPVVTTKIGAEGLPAAPFIRLAETPETFATEIAQLVQEKTSFKFNQQYLSLTWQAIFDKYISLLEKYPHKSQTPA